ncbi:hypothetical protein C5Z26_04070 [Lactobacillus sp. CBA3606]|uniref:WxL domain-containing protein n=1 Tax=Lactobacillus sp. CBA3606 TaxID=2099789 RepID=UPI000CFD63D6|nr:WxL domain-containing protein [Lactobacillus sp. CBA3606]AVK63324.1 hypothetical protein C5Z26_04070 [Lactobacillus sp. CBA3606]
MKKMQLVLGLVATLGLSAVYVIPAQAADTAAVTAGNSVGEFTVDAGQLELTSVPDFEFANTDVKTVMTTNPTLAYTGAGVANPATATSGTVVGAKTAELTVSDYRGATTPDWNVQAAISPFKNGSTSVNGAITYSASNGIDAKTIGTAAAEVWDNTSAKTGGIGAATATTADTSTLALDQASSVNAGTYDATITWTLSNTASTTTP